MAARVITFAVQIGSGGFEVAHLVAERIKYSYYDWEVTSQAAAQAGVSPEDLATAEHLPSLPGQLMERFLTFGAAGDDLTMGNPSAATMYSAIRALTSDQYRQFIERTVKALAEHGEAVIVGHAGQVVLQKDPGVLKVLIHGTTKRRAGRLALEADTGKQDPEILVTQSDRQRERFFKRIYHIDLLDAAVYDLTLNTDQLDAEAAAGIVVAAAQAMPGYVAESQSKK